MPPLPLIASLVVGFLAVLAAASPQHTPLEWASDVARSGDGKRFTWAAAAGRTRAQWEHVFGLRDVDEPQPTHRYLATPQGTRRVFLDGTTFNMTCPDGRDVCDGGALVFWKRNHYSRGWNRQFRGFYCDDEVYHPKNGLVCREGDMTFPEFGSVGKDICCPVGFDQMDALCQRNALFSLS